MNHFKKTLLLSCLISGTCLMADDEPENTLVVTSDYRASDLEDTTTSVTLFTEETLKQAAEQHMEEVINLIPNLNWAGGSSRPRYFQIRGIGERSQYEGAPNPSVAMIIDDIDFSSMGMMANLFDVSQLEVLRGPQSARYGANAIAGMINVRTRDPQAENELNSQFILGDYDTLGTAVSVSGALSDDDSVLGLVSIDRYENNGFRNNTYLGRDDTNGRDELTLRAKVHWSLSDQDTLKFTLLHSDLDNGYDAWALDNTYTTLTDKPGKDSQESQAFAGRYEHTGENVDWLFITTHAAIDAIHSFDGDWGNPEYWGIYGPYDFTSDTDRERDTSTQEIRVLSKPVSANQSMDWVVGLYRQTLEENNDIIELYNGGVYRTLESTYDADTLALYGQVRWQLSEETNLSVSLRRERRESTYTDSNPLSFNPTDTMTGGDISLTHKLSDELTAWASIARGYKAGGFNLSLSVPDALREYQPEYLWNYEAGLRGSSANGQVRWSASIFEMAREDVQISTSTQLDPNDPLTFVFLVDNAAEGTNRGLEAALEVVLAQDWSLDASLGYLDTSIDSLKGGDQALVGREQAHAPGYMATLALNYHDDQGWFGRLELNAKDEFFYSNSHQQKAPSSEIVNLKFGYQEANWSAYLWTRNVTDEPYTVRGFFFANEPPNWEDKRYTRLGDPRHIGVTLRYQY